MLINVSRGRLIHTRALIEALKSGHMGGVALDVYEEEEGIFFEDLSGEVLHDDELARLLSFPNVLVTAHQAFLTHEALSEIARDHRRKRFTFCRQAALARRNRSLIAIQEHCSKMNVQLATLPPHRGSDGSRSGLAVEDIK